MQWDDPMNNESFFGRKEMILQWVRYKPLLPKQHNFHVLFHEIPFYLIFVNKMFPNNVHHQLKLQLHGNIKFMIWNKGILSS